MPQLSLADISKLIKEKFPETILEEQKEALVVKKEDLLNLAHFLKGSDLNFDSLHCVTAVDWKDKIEVVYFFHSMTNRHWLRLKIRLPMTDLTVETLSHIWQSANWLERETYDLYGVKFLHHPDLRRILNPDEWTEFPLRKDFKRADFIKKPETLGLKAS